MDWIDLVQNRDRSQAIVKAVKNLWFHKMRRISWVVDNLLASLEGPWSMELVGWLGG
jgi:hypothetical protein